jgi:hypothetical protein
MNKEKIENIDLVLCDKEDEEEGLPIAPEDLDSVLDIYSYSNKDLLNKYKEVMVKFKETGLIHYQDLAELLEVELYKNGIEIEACSGTATTATATT